ncbi:HIT domain-containing protein [Solidesulfovibrio sp.]
MNFGELVDFLEHRMAMQHIYQPLLIRSLVDAGGSATIRQLALAFLDQDESQIVFYERKIKEMPLKVLQRRGVVASSGNLVELTTGRLSFEEKAQIRMICDRKLQEYILKRGLGIWDYRMLETDPVPGSLRNRVLAESGGRCALCGATNQDRPLDVDHIRPRSKGGGNEYANLQILCSKCNRAKGNKEDTDYRTMVQDDAVPGCPFCYDAARSRVVEEFDSVFAIPDGYPVSAGHQLVITKRHTPDWFAMTQAERNDADSLLRILKNRLAEDDNTITGFNIGMNSGASAGQTVFHVHIHLIPRREGDTENPRGGVRGVIPGKMGY